MTDLIDRDALLKDMGLTDAVKYGNKDAGMWGNEVKKDETTGIEIEKT